MAHNHQIVLREYPIFTSVTFLEWRQDISWQDPQKLTWKERFIQTESQYNIPIRYAPASRKTLHPTDCLIFRGLCAT